MKNTDDKLTLKLKRASIARGKAVAKQRGTSVSRMVEDYFDQIAPLAPSARESAHPIVDSLAGRVKVASDFDWKKEKETRLLKRYGLK